MSRERHSISTISTDSGGSEDSYDRRVSIPEGGPGPPFTVGPIIVHPGGTGVLHGNLNNYVLNQYIIPSGEELDPEAVKDLVTDAVVKFSTDTKEKFFPKDETIDSKPPVDKKDLQVLQRRWCLVMVALVVLSLVTLLSTFVFSIPYINGNSPIIPQIISNEDSSDSLGADLAGAPRMLSRQTWVAQPPVNPLDSNNLPAKLVVVVHTVTDPCNTTAKCILAVRLIQQFHVDSRGWNDIGYNFLVGGDGCVYVGRGWDKTGAHTKGYNKGTLGIAFVGTFSHQLPNKSQMEAFNKLVSLGVTLGKISKDYSLVAQCQLQTTASPGGDLVRNMTSWPHFDSSRPLTTCTDLKV